MDLQAAENLAYSLMAEHLKDVQDEWTFAWCEFRYAAARCSFEKKQLQLSRPGTLINDEDEIRRTIIHEIAHVIAGPTAGHGWKFRIACLKLGGDGKTCTETAKAPDGRYQATCPDCSYVLNAYKALKRWKGRVHNGCRTPLTWYDTKTGALMT